MMAKSLGVACHARGPACWLSDPGGELCQCRFLREASGGCADARRNPIREGDFFGHVTSRARVDLAHLRKVSRWKPGRRSDKSRPQPPMGAARAYPFQQREAPLPFSHPVVAAGQPRFPAFQILHLPISQQLSPAAAREAAGLGLTWDYGGSIVWRRVGQLTPAPKSSCGEKLRGGVVRPAPKTKLRRTNPIAPLFSTLSQKNKPNAAPARARGCHHTSLPARWKRAGTPGLPTPSLEPGTQSIEETILDRTNPIGPLFSTLRPKNEPNAPPAGASRPQSLDPRVTLWNADRAEPARCRPDSPLRAPSRGGRIIAQRVRCRVHARTRARALQGRLHSPGSTLPTVCANLPGLPCVRHRAWSY
jgi:hypothetical protein